MKLSQKYSDHHAEIIVSTPYLAGIGVIGRLQILPAKLLSIQGNTTDYETVYAKYIDPSFHFNVIDEMKAAYDVSHTEMDGLKNVLKANQDITLLTLDYQKLHIHQDAATRHKVPAPTISPANNQIKNSHLVTKMFSSNPTVGHEKDGHLPEDVGKIGRKVAVVAIGAPIPLSGNPAYVALAAIGATKYDLVFTPEQAQKQGYIISWYISPTGETGPESDPSPFDII